MSTRADCELLAEWNRRREGETFEERRDRVAAADWDTRSWESSMDVDTMCLFTALWSLQIALSW
jgi:hypothetical protein